MTSSGAGWPPWSPDVRPLRLRDHATTLSETCAGEPDDQADVLVLLHAALVDRHMWSRFVTRLVALQAGSPGRQPWRIVGYDMRGHGSAGPVALRQVGDLVDDLVQVVDQLGARRVHVAGSSLGGAVGLLAALTVPERLASLIAIATSPTFPTDVLTDRARLGATTPADHTRDTLGRCLTEETLREAGSSVDYLTECLATFSSASWSSTWLSLADFDVAARVHEIAVPVLAVAGSADRAAPVAALERISTGVQQGRLATIDGAAHMVALERPDALADEVAHFLNHVTDRVPGAS